MYNKLPVNNALSIIIKFLYSMTVRGKQDMKPNLQNRHYKADIQA